MLKNTLLLILDGYGLADNSKANAAFCAKTPNLDRLFSRPEMVPLNASGEHVGLPAGFMGNSEVGHLNIGAGRVVLQDMQGIDTSILRGDFDENPALLEMFAKVKKNKIARLHLMGLLSDGGVHSHINHVIALIRLAHRHNISVYLHAFTDGRDTAPCAAIEYIEKISPVLAENKAVFASICGRYYAMDRDKRWDRLEKVWKTLVLGEGELCQDICEDLCNFSPVSLVKSFYKKNISDEFIEPTLLISPERSSKELCVQDGDAVFFFNFRSDRARQLAHVFTDNPQEPRDFPFDRKRVPKLSAIGSMTQYESTLDIPFVYAKKNIINSIGEFFSKKGYKQFRIAETEKYAHVTYFFNGGREEAFEGEDRCLILSPKGVATYDLKPEMSVAEVTEKLIHALSEKKYDFIVCNLANLDMVGHTGNFDAAVRACEIVDLCVMKIEEAVLANDGLFCITADHGNVEEMLDAHNEIQTAHSLNKVPFLVENKDGFVVLNSAHAKSQKGKLADIAPTLLDILGLEIPTDMDGISLF